MDEKQPANAKPLILAMEEAEADLVGTVNHLLKKHALPCYLFEVILDKVHRDLKAAARQEVATASAQYTEQTKGVEKT